MHSTTTISRGCEQLAHFGTEFINRETCDIAWDSPVPEYDAITLEHGRRSWISSFNEEFRSLEVAAQLIVQLTRAGATLRTLTSAARVLRDEARHIDYAERFVQRLGGFKEDQVDPVWIDSNPNYSDVLNAAIKLLVFYCLFETASCLLIRGKRETATDPVAKTVLEQLLRDESFHSRFGWLALEDLFPLLSANEREILTSNLAPAFKFLEQQFVQPDDGNYVPSPFGSIPPQRKTQLFNECVMKRMLPTLESLGLPGDRAWKNRNQAGVRII